MLVMFSNHIPHLVVGTLLLPDRESAKIHSNQANPIIRGPNQSLTSPTGMHNSLPLLNPNYSIANVHPVRHAKRVARTPASRPTPTHRVSVYPAAPSHGIRPRKHPGSAIQNRKVRRIRPFLTPFCPLRPRETGELPSDKQNLRQDHP